jgi:hypothetical protein
MIAALLLKYWRWLALIALIAGVWASLSYWGHTKYRDGVAYQKAKDKAVFDKLADLTARTKTAVTNRETEIKGLLDSSNKAREEGIAHAVEEQQRIVAGVRDGSLRLREQWRGCEAALAVSGDSSAVGTSDDAADLRATGAGDLIRTLDDADVQVAELQRYAVACQRALRPLDIP